MFLPTLKSNPSFVTVVFGSGFFKPCLFFDLDIACSSVNDIIAHLQFMLLGG